LKKDYVNTEFLSKLDKILVRDSSMRKEVCKYLGGDCDKVVVVRSVLDVSKYEFEEKDF